MPIRVALDYLLTARGLSVGEFAEKVGITPANVAVLKNGRARAVRFSTLDAICRVLECQPGDILVRDDDQPPANPASPPEKDHQDPSRIQRGQYSS